MIFLKPILKNSFKQNFFEIIFASSKKERGRVLETESQVEFLWRYDIQPNDIQ
jgi:hypothetical protein